MQLKPVDYFASVIPMPYLNVCLLKRRKAVVLSLTSYHIWIGLKKHTKDMDMSFIFNFVPYLEVSFPFLFGICLIMSLVIILFTISSALIISFFFIWCYVISYISIWPILLFITNIDDHGRFILFYFLTIFYSNMFKRNSFM